MKKLNSKGLTLIELMIVVAILGIVISIVGPHLCRTTDRNTSGSTNPVDFKTNR